MKTSRLLVIGLVAFFEFNASPATRYVNLNSALPAAPYTSWAGAATRIQDAIDVANPGDVILVTNGVYQTGGRAVYGTLVNRVAVTKALTVQSVNGPLATVIQGNRSGTVVRCVYLTNNATLTGFTLRNGASQSSGDITKEQYGGGLWCETTNALISNCVLSNNVATFNGGGVYLGTLTNCLIISNAAPMAPTAPFRGGGAYGSVLNNCTLIGNSCGEGGGAYLGTLRNCDVTGNAGGSGGGVSGSTVYNSVFSGNTAYSGGAASGGTLNNCTITANSAAGSGGGTSASTLRNCIVFFNNAPASPNYSGGTFTYCCTTPLPAGTGNRNNPPQLADLIHLSTFSPCRGTGSSTFASGLDMDGQVWANPPSIGCDEYVAGFATGALGVTVQAAFTNTAPGYAVTFSGEIVGVPTASRWDFGDGTILSNQLLSVSHVWTNSGDYVVSLWAYNETFTNGVSASVSIKVLANAVQYVAVTSTNPIAPYLTWETAATNIQSALDVAFPFSTVLVSNGVYQTGGRVARGALTNRVAVMKPLALRSVNGPAVTTIRGFRPATTNGDSAVRCVYLTNGASFTGFTVVNGGTRSSGDQVIEQSGGGLWCESSNTPIADCVFTNNTAQYHGAGVYRGALTNCTLVGNNSVVRGGGGAESVLRNCLIVSNRAGSSGGGIYSSTLRNCVIQGCYAGYSGGGSENGTLFDCQISSNSALSMGGAASGGVATRCRMFGNSSANGGAMASGTVNDSLLVDNSATDGGAAWYSTLNQCTLTSNSANNSGGGAHACTANNSILYDNTAPQGPNYFDGSLRAMVFNSCCTTPLPTGPGNITGPPLFVNAAQSDFHLLAGSPCINAGENSYVTTSSDLDGSPRIFTSYVDMGAYEFQSAAPIPLSLVLGASYTNAGTGFTVGFTGQLTGHGTVNRWDFGDGTVVFTSALSASHSWTLPGDYVVTLWAQNSSYPGGVNATIMIHVLSNPVHYVRRESTNAVAPYLSWATAATKIQDAIDASFPGGSVLVSNGVYNLGGVTNRVFVSKPIVVRSVQGPEVTIIDAKGSMRAVFLTNNSALTGFTVTGGLADLFGGGIYSTSSNSIVSNCIIRGNRATNEGGGVYGATLFNCLLISNTCVHYGGGASMSVLSNCTLRANTAFGGGAASFSTMKRCLVESNTAEQGGGGIITGDLFNCVIRGNFAGSWGGGVWGGTYRNCTIASNSCVTAQGGGIYAGTFINCVVYENISLGPPVQSQNYNGGSFDHSCTTPLPAGSGNFTNPPLFVDLINGNLRLDSNSPCINTGLNGGGIGNLDVDGRPRVIGGTIDLGAYEFQLNVNGSFLGWLQQYGLPLNGSADWTDVDQDGLNNWQEWQAGTTPTNAASVLLLFTPAFNPAGISVMWQSVNGKTYFLERAIHLDGPAAFSGIQSNIPGQTDMTTYIDTTATNDGPYFYRVGVQ